MKNILDRNRVSLLVVCVLLAALLLPYQHVQGATCTIASGAWNTSGNWSCGHVPLSTDDVVMNGSVSISSTAGVCNSLTINSGTLTLTAGLTISGTGDALVFNGGTIALSGRTLLLSGAGGDIKLGGTASTTYHITGTGTTSIVQFTGAKTIVNVASQTLTFGANVIVDLYGGGSAYHVSFGNGASHLAEIDGTLRIENGTGVPPVVDLGPNYGSASTLDYYVGATMSSGDEWPAYTTASLSPYNVIIEKSGTGVSLPANQSRTVRGTLTTQGSGTLLFAPSCNPGTPSPCVLHIDGNWINAGGTFNIGSNGGTVSFEGSTPQTIGDTTHVTTFHDLTIDNPAGVQMLDDAHVQGRLTLTSGVLDVNNTTLFMDEASDVTNGAGADVYGSYSASNMVAAYGGYGADTSRMCKLWNVNPGAPTFFFPIGDLDGGANYSPVSYVFDSGVYTDFSICVKVYDQDPTSSVYLSNDLPPYINYITRFWYVYKSGTTYDGIGAHYVANFYYDDTPGQDVVNTESLMLGRMLNSSVWYPFYHPNPDYSFTFDKTMEDFSNVTPVGTPEGGQNVLTYYTGGNDTNAVLISGPEVAPTKKEIQLQWTTMMEQQMAGFNIYRADSLTGARTQLNSTMLPALHAGSPQGDSYQFTDTTAAAGVKYYYWLEMVGAGTSNQTFGPTEGTRYSNFVYLPSVIH